MLYLQQCIWMLVLIVVIIWRSCRSGLQLKSSQFFSIIYCSLKTNQTRQERDKNENFFFKKQSKNIFDLHFVGMFICIFGLHSWYSFKRPMFRARVCGANFNTTPALKSSKEQNFCCRGRARNLSGRFQGGSQRGLSIRVCIWYSPQVSKRGNPICKCHRRVDLVYELENFPPFTIVLFVLCYKTDLEYKVGRIIAGIKENNSTPKRKKKKEKYQLVYNA